MTHSIEIRNNPVLTELYRGYQPVEADYIQNQILPVLSTGSESGDIINLGTTSQDMLRIHNTVIVGRTKTPEIRFSLSKAVAYKCEKRGLKVLVTIEDANKFKKEGETIENAKAKAKNMFTKFLKTATMLGREVALASALFSTSTFTNYTTLTGADKFSDYVNSDPIGVSTVAKNTIRKAIGKKPNVCIMGPEVEMYLVNHPQLKKTNGVAPDGTVPVRALERVELAKALGVDKILVGEAQYQTSKLGETAVKTDIWGKYMLFAYVNPSPVPEEFQLSLGYQFVQNESVIDEWDIIDPKDATFVREESKYDDVILDELAGYLIAGAVI